MFAFRMPVSVGLTTDKMALSAAEVSAVTLTTASMLLESGRWMWIMSLNKMPAAPDGRILVYLR
jgi:hypothetical protein